MTAHNGLPGQHLTTVSWLPAEVSCTGTGKGAGSDTGTGTGTGKVSGTGVGDPAPVLVEEGDPSASPTPGCHG